MKKKIGTYPGGRIITVTYFIIVFLFAFFSVIAFIIGEIAAGAAIAFYTALMTAVVVIMLAKKFWNVVYLTDEGIRHKKDAYSWDDVYITVNPVGFPYSHGIAFYIHFSDRYLLETEVNSKEIKRKGFYLAATDKRLKSILPSYCKEVKVLELSKSGIKMFETIGGHNGKIKERRDGGGGTALDKEAGII